MASQSQTLAIGLLVVFILIVIRYAWAAVQKPMVVPYVPSLRSVAEGFKVAPTRAADCRCLAGYVPAKGGDTYFCKSLSDPEKRRDCY